MEKLIINEELCKGCALCYDICPKKILKPGEHLNSKGFHPITCTDRGACTSCATCYRVCPDLVFTVYRAESTVTVDKSLRDYK